MLATQVSHKEAVQVKSRIGQHMWKLALMSALVVAILAMAAGSAFAVGALSEKSWVVSNSQTGATAVGYTYTFTPATTGTISKVTMTVPAGTAATVEHPEYGEVYGLGGGSVALASNTLTYSVTAPLSVTAGTPIYIQITGLTNTSTRNTYTSTITTWDNAGTPAEIDSGITAAIDFGGNSTAVEVDVAQTLVFTNNTVSFSLGVDPTNTNTKNEQAIVALSVKTNAEHGYTLSVNDNAEGLKNAHDVEIPRVSDEGVASGSFPANGFGFLVTDSSGTGTISLANASYFYGFADSAGLTEIFANDEPTGNDADMLTMTNKVAVDFEQEAGNYTDTITYTATPRY